MKFDNKLGRDLIVLFMLFPLFVLSQKEYFPTNSGVKVVNEPKPLLMQQLLSTLREQLKTEH